MANWLAARGLVLYQRNYRSRLGEIDLIMADDDTLVFVEVRYRSSMEFGGAEGSVTPAKQQRIVRAARQYLGQHPEHSDRPCRFDVVAAGPSPDRDGKTHYHWIRNAFYGD